MNKKEEKNKEKGEGSETEGLLSLRGITGDKLAKMSVADVVRSEGLLPFNPLHIVTDDEAEKLGAHAGAVYGASVASLGQAIARKDLSVNKRVNLGMKGIRPILSAVLTAWETSNLITEKEEEILFGQLLEGERGGRGVNAADVIADLQERLKMSEADTKKMREEMAVLRKKKG